MVSGVKLLQTRLVRETMSCPLAQRTSVDAKVVFSGWWFQIFFNFIPTWGNDPI